MYGGIMLDEITIQRLGLIRYLYETAMEESRRPEPFGLISILKFHDSVELFLDLACDKFGIQSNKTQHFRDYWIEIEKHLQNKTLSEKRSMERLNNARVAFKHHGNLPHASSIEKFRVNVTDFFDENTPLIFGIEFRKVSMTYLIQNDAVKKLLEEATTLIAEEKRSEAIRKIALAFTRLLEDYLDSKETWRYQNIFFSRETFPPTYNNNYDRELNEFATRITSSIDTLRQGMQILSLGINYQQYAKFRLLTPSVTRTADGKYHTLLRTPEKQPTIEQCSFCFDFVISCASHIQNFEFEIET